MSARRPRLTGASAPAGGAEAEDLEPVGRDPEARPAADLAEHLGQAVVVDVERPPAAGADRVVVVDRVAGDVGVVAAGQVDALHEARAT